MFAVHDPKFWEPYKSTPAWEYERYIELAEKGVVPPAIPRATQTPEQRLALQREDLEVSIKYTKELITKLG
jgi:hypothetical protein